MAKKATTSKSRKKSKVIARRKSVSRTPRPAAEAPARGGATKLDALIALLRTRRGASVPDMMVATGWQAHSVRGALAGALKKRGLTITSEKTDGERRYRIEAGA